MPLTIYAIDVPYGSGTPKLASATVERETTAFYMIDGEGPAFGWRRRVPKDGAHLTPEAA